VGGGGTVCLSHSNVIVFQLFGLKKKDEEILNINL